MLQIFAILDDTSVMNFGKKLQRNFPKMRGGRGVKGCLELFQKFIHFGRGMRPLVWRVGRFDTLGKLVSAHRAGRPTGRGGSPSMAGGGR